MTQSISNGLDQLFELLIPFSKEFNKNTYAAVFQEKYREFKPLFAEIAQVCEDSDNRFETVNEIAGVLPDKMKMILGEESSKRKKETILMGYNLGMVAFVIPMFRYGRMDACEEVVDRMIERWNDNGLSADISKSTFEEIQGGFKSHFCYITTAVCKSLGKTDDCYELNLMRDYRDGYLSGCEDGAGIIKEYYDIAPTIVKRINRLNEADAVYREIWNRYLLPCVTLIKEDRLEECKETYIDMVHYLQKKYFFS